MFSGQDNNSKNLTTDDEFSNYEMCNVVNSYEMFITNDNYELEDKDISNNYSYVVDNGLTNAVLHCSDDSYELISNNNQTRYDFVVDVAMLRLIVIQMKSLIALWLVPVFQ